MFAVTTFGESHGPALGVIVDGVPAGLEIDPSFIQSEMDRRKPGQSAMTTARQESDTVEILSGVFEGKSTGTPIAMMLRNADHHSTDYSNIANTFRPGHADFTFEKKFGLRDYRGGGRSSGRETAARVAAGAIAKIFLKESGIIIRACTDQIGNIRAEQFDWSSVENNPVRTADPAAAEAMFNEVKAATKDGDSIGGGICCEILNLPIGLGEPVFDKFDAMLAHAMLSLGGVKGIEFGAGFSVCSMRGSENNDPLQPGDHPFVSNNAGGILGGISNGEAITFELAVKPTPSISAPQSTINNSGEAVTLEISGRHDPCIVPRIVPVVEAMAALVLADAALRNRATRLQG